MSLKERGKFKEETLVNYGGRTRRADSGASGPSAVSDQRLLGTLGLHARS